MHIQDLIDKALLTLEVGNSTPLFILLAKDGTIHRKGNGNPAANLPLITGTSEDGHFEALMMTINPHIFTYTGVIRMPEPVGTECRLTIIFQGRSNIDISFRVVYGADSQGPPIEIAEILINAVKLTDAWYNQQLGSQQPGGEEKKWWQVWK